MPRPLLRRTQQFCYHVTTRANNREWFYIPIDDCWRVLTHKLSLSSHRYGAEIHSFVLMSNHFHLLLTTPKGNLDDVMRYFLSIATQEIQQRTERINHIFGSRYKWTILNSPLSLAYAYKYVLRNPVRAKLCQRVEDYRWSTHNDLKTKLALSEGFNGYWKFIPKPPSSRNAWLNQPSDREAENLIKRALRRYEFKFTTDSNFQSELRNLRQNYGIEEMG